MEIDSKLAFQNVIAQCGAGKPIGGAVVTTSGKILYQENFDKRILKEIIYLIPQLRVGDFLSTGNHLIIRVSTGISIILNFINEQKAALAQLSLVGRIAAFAGWFDYLDTDDYNINSLKLTYPEHREICHFLGCDPSTVIGKILELVVEKGEATKEELIQELGKNENIVKNALGKLVKSAIIEENEGKYKIHTRLITIKLLHCPNTPPTT